MYNRQKYGAPSCNECDDIRLVLTLTMRGIFFLDYNFYKDSDIVRRPKNLKQYHLCNRQKTNGILFQIFGPSHNI